MNPIIRIHDLKKDKIVDREMTADELVEWELQKSEYEKQQAEEAALAAARQGAQDKLKALGLTDLEIAAITGA